MSVTERPLGRTARQRRLAIALARIEGISRIAGFDQGLRLQDINRIAREALSLEQKKR